MELQDNGYNELLKRFNEIEGRLRRIERRLKISSPSFESDKDTSTTKAKDNKGFEQTLGQFWFAKVGVVILTMAFLLPVNLKYVGLPQILPVLAGYLIGGAFLIVSHFSKKSYDFVSRYLFGGGLVLLFFATLRFYFFGTEQLIENAGIESALLLLVTGGTLYASVKRVSVYLAALGMVMGYFSALINENAYVIFIILSVLSIGGVYLKKRMNWSALLFLSISLTYLAHLLWSINNPFFTGQFALIGKPEFNVIFLLIYISIFAYGIYDKEYSAGAYMPVTQTFFNLGLGYGIFFMITVATFKETIPIYHLFASVVFMSIAFLMWHYCRKDIYTLALNAIAGYTALSVAIVAFFNIPDYFNVLIWESLIVILTSLYFKSKFIIYANFGMFLAILIAFLLSAGEFSLVSLSFGFVALISARLLHWKNDYLGVKNQFLRNGYLTVAFITIPLALYQSLPKTYLIYSWIGVTAFYYLLSFLLTNRKYRWMGHSTLLLTVVYILIIGTTEFDPIYRILAFIVVGVALLIVSVFYTREKLKSTEEHENS